MTDTTNGQIKVSKADLVSISDKVSSTDLFNSGYDLSDDPLTVAALVREIERRVREGGLVALQTLREIARDRQAPAAARVAAARGLAEIARLTGTKQSAGDTKEPEEMTLAELHDRQARLEQELGKRARLIPPKRSDDVPQLSDLLG